LLAGLCHFFSLESMKKSYQDLNDEQRSAMFHNAGPALILAGAG
jgi:hypothetical protein